ncbi:MAG: hypothetical protein DLM72_20410 [Candidatus Nitrosopolaris wilkensis]|nr:MAG: hypothetical protein DLM72_20410 [Candidatus Nitrosopolaris wilkensis]
MRGVFPSSVHTIGKNVFVILMHIINDMYRRITVGLRQDVYTKLRDRGKFGESFSDLVSRIIDEANKHTVLGEETLN